MKNLFYLLLALKVLGMDMSWWIVLLPLLMIGLKYVVKVCIIANFAYKHSQQHGISFIEALQEFAKK